MVFQKYIFSLLFILFTNILFGQRFGLEGISSSQNFENIPFTLENTTKNIDLLKNHNIEIKRITENWIYFSTTPDWIRKQLENNKLSDIY